MTPPAVDLVEEALRQIDLANSADPNLVSPNGAPEDVAVPKEILHSQRMTYWLGVLEPEASDAQRLAARAHHFRRWLSPRDAFPAGRAGYLKWRIAARARHASEVDELLATVGLSDQMRFETAAIIAKQGLGADPRVQVHEDALCLVFFELQGAAVLEKLGPDADRVVARTANKMSSRARRLAADLGLPAPVVAMLLDDSTVPPTEPLIELPVEEIPS